MFKKTKFVIAGKHPFPMCLLTIEQIVPAKEQDAQMLNLTLYSIPCTLEFYRYSEGGTKTNVDQWKAYGWTVVSDEGV